MPSESGVQRVGSNRRVEDLRKAVDDSVQQLRAATFTLVSAALYLFVAGLGTSHLDLLVGRMVKLPIFEVEVSLRWFYVLAPLVLLVLHFTVLNLCGLVAQRLRELQNELRRSAAPQLDQKFILGLLYPYPLVERLAHPPDKPVIRFLLNFSIYIPTVIMPILVLLWLELRFLPYQSLRITSLHALYVVLDLIMLWILWARVFRKAAKRAARLAAEQKPPGSRRPFSTWVFTDLALTTFTAVLATVLVCGSLRWAFESFATLRVERGTVSGNTPAEQRARLTSISEDELTARLMAIQRYDRQKPDFFTSVIESGYARIGVSLQNRSLRGAILTGTSLVGADLTNADLTSADLRAADLRGAILEGATLDNAQLNFAHLEGADLTNASVRGANLPFAQFQGAILHGTDFSGADLTGAHLQFVRFDDPEPRSESSSTHASNEPPIFRGAILKGAQFQGTPIERGSAEKATIDLRGADLRGAQMDGVDLQFYNLAGADLSGYAALPEDEGSHTHVCDNPLVLADCAGPLRRPKDVPNFATLSYDAARIVTFETLQNIGFRLRKLAESRICLLSADGQCGTSSASAAAVNVEEDVNDTIAGIEAMADLDEGPYAAARDVAAQVERLAESAEWCHGDNPVERAYYMRAFVHRINEYRCQYSASNSTHDAVYGGKLEIAERQVLKACPVEVKSFVDYAIAPVDGVRAQR